MRAYVWLFGFAAAFWLIYDQAGSVLNLFAEERTDRTVAGFTFPASWLQSVNPVLIMIGAPLFAVLWLKTGNRISTPVKFTAGLVLNGLSFVIMAGAAQLAVGGAKVSPWWLVAAYAVQVCGEPSFLLWANLAFTTSERVNGAPQSGTYLCKLASMISK